MRNGSMIRITLQMTSTILDINRGYGFLFARNKQRVSQLGARSS